MKKSINLQWVMFVMLILLSGILVGSFFINENLILRNVLLFSKDHVIASSTVTAVKMRIRTITALLIIFLASILMLLRSKTAMVKNKVRLTLGNIRWQNIFSLAKNKNVLHAVIVLLLLYFGVVCVFMIHSNDIGADEAYYLGSVKNFYKNGQFNLPSYDHAEFRSQLIYYPFYLIRIFFPFSMYSLRLLVFFYSLILLFVMYILFRKRYSVAGYLVLLLLLVSDRSVVLVASTGFGEVPAFLFLIIGILLWTNDPNRRINLGLAAGAFALAALTKSQILPILTVLIVMFIVLRDDDRISNLMLLFYTCALYVAGSFLFVLVQGYSFAEAIVSLWNILGRSSEVAFALPVIQRLSHVNSIFNVLNITIFAFVVVYQMTNYRKTSLFEKALFAYSLLTFLWWIFLYFGVNARNLVYAIMINYILFAVIIVRIIKEIRDRWMTFLVGTVCLFLVLNFVNSSIFCLRMVDKGISDEYNFALIGYETYSEGTLKSGQKDFFTYVNSGLDPDMVMYCVSMDIYRYVLTDREMSSIERGKDELKLPVGSYVVLTYIDYKNAFVWGRLLEYLNNNADIVFNKGLYEVYRIRQ